MKILQLRIINNFNEEVRNIRFNSNGISIIYGKITKPKDDKKTSNSIGKTLLFKFISYILGRKEMKKDYPEEICGWVLDAKVLYENREYNVMKMLGESELQIDNVSYSYTKYINFFKIDKGVNSKQLLLEKRSNIISSITKAANKDDIKNFLKLLELNELVDIFMNTKKEQEKLKTYNAYNSFFKEDLKKLQQEQFVLEQKKLKLEQELNGIKNKIDKLNITEDSLQLIKIHSEKSSILKENKIQLEQNQLKINRLKTLIEQCAKSDISYNDIIQLYEQANITIPEMTRRTLNEVQEFYDNMFKDKVSIYEKEILEIEEENKKLDTIILEKTKELDNISSKIADNNLFKEAMNLYEIKNAELLDNQEEYGKIIGMIEDLSNKKKIEENIKNKYNVLEDELSKYNELINKYRKYVYNLVNEIYDEERDAYFDIEIPSSRKIQSMPIKVELNLKGDKGEGISAVKNIVIDLLIFYYNNLVEYLIQDSSCFEGIDKRQTATLILKGSEIANLKNKQYIISLNDYHLQKDNEELMNLITNSNITVLELSEEDLLLKKRI